MPTKENKKKSATPPEPEIKAKTKGKTETPVRVSTAVRHRNVIKDMAVNGGSLKKALKKNGYSKSVQETPSKVTKTKTFKQLLDQYLPESKLLDLHDKQLNSWRLQSMLFQKQVSDEDIFELLEGVNCVVKKLVEIPTGKICFYICPDNMSRNKALELGLKLHKRLTDKIEVRDTTPYTQLTDAELAQRIKAGKAFFTKK